MFIMVVGMQRICCKDSWRAFDLDFVQEVAAVREVTAPLLIERTWSRCVIFQNSDVTFLDGTKVGIKKAYF